MTTNSPPSGTTYPDHLPVDALYDTVPIRRLQAADLAVPRSRTRTALLVAAVLAVAVNLRTGISSVGAALPELEAALSLPPAITGVLTSAAPLCFAAAAAVLPAFPRLRPHRAVVGCLVLLCAGLSLRVIGGTWELLVGTIVAYGAIAVCNILLPALVRQGFSARAGSMLSSAYAACISTGVGASAAATPLLSASSGWRIALAVWAIPPVVAAVLCFAAVRGRRLAPVPSPDHDSTQVRSVLRSRRAWALTLFFGLQSLLSMTVLSWLPAMLRALTGMSASTAGVLLAVTMAVAIIASLLISIVAASRRALIGAMVTTTVSGGLGLTGLLLMPAATPAHPVVWSVLLGVGLAALAPALSMVTRSARDAREAARLSALCQGVGYLIAATGPLVVSVLAQSLHNFPAAIVFLISACLVQLGAALLVLDTTRRQEGPR